MFEGNGKALAEDIGEAGNYKNFEAAVTIVTIASMISRQLVN